MSHDLKRHYGYGHLHFVTFSCYRRLPLLGSARRRDLFLRCFEATRRSYRFIVVGYVVMPEPQRVTLRENDFRFGPEWRLETGPGVNPNDTAIEALKSDLESRFHLRLDGRSGGGVVRLTMAPNSVAIGAGLVGTSYR